ncbi:MAG: membrane protein insertase YidC [Alphaproteobacteria bacterium]|nr:membrane protein insertase YidC [Alphaproteobacteria bacterium]
MSDTRNMILAVVLSMIVLFGWQFFVAGPQMQQAQEQAEARAASEEAANQSALATPNLATPNLATSGGGETPVVGVQPGPATGTREQLVATAERIAISTPSLSGSINLLGGRIDDLRLNKYRETTDPESDIITLFSPLGSPTPYFAEQGWIGAGGAREGLPTSETVWEVTGNRTLAPDRPVTLRYDNGEGLRFARKISLDENYLFTIEQTVSNDTSGDVALFPYSLVSRHETPQVSGFFILHEGLIGVLGTKNLIETSYKDIRDKVQDDVESTGGWLGITDKYWAAAVIPDVGTNINARFGYSLEGGQDTYQTSYVEQNPVVVQAGSVGGTKSYLYAGAKVEAVIDGYEKTLGIDRLELLIDWGWFQIITRPLFYLIRALNSVLGNFGLAILAVTVLIKAALFWFANKSYASMAGMKKVQPEMKAIQEQYKDDRATQQQKTMELYKREKINPLSGCWPILIQIPIFFSLYKVLFVTIEMRQAPFFGWIQDLAAPDPTTVFNLFGLLPYDPTVVPLIGPFLALGVWPLIMGVTMFLQMRLNPPPADPTSQMIFAWMPVIFTFMLASFPAGLVIYWAWNNFLSMIQQYAIMRRHGVDVDFIGNITSAFRRNRPDQSKG